MASEVKGQDRKIDCAMLRRDEFSNYPVAARTSFSQPVFHRTSTTRRIESLERDNSQEAMSSELLRAAASCSRSPSPSGGYEDDQDEQEEEEEVFSTGQNHTRDQGDQIPDQQAPRSRPGEALPVDPKQHVGPLGIFFKVWSLVKVTKARHSKLRRQNSENAAQFQYISGDCLKQAQQLAGSNRPPPPLGRLQQAASNSHLIKMQDRHFRHSSASQQQLGNSSALQRVAQEAGSLSNRLKLSLPGSGRPPVTATTSATNSTSSGVSSSNNSTLANCSPPPPALPVGRAAPSNLRLGGMRRSTTELFAQPKAPEKREPGSKSSWASRIRRSATSVNAASEQARICATGSGAYKRPQSNRQADNRRRTSPEAILPAGVGELDAGEEEDSNDVYTTPNDSIQSVPGSAPPSSQQNPFVHLQQKPLFSQQTDSFTQMTKSFSTNNFGHLIGSSSLIGAVPAREGKAKVELEARSSQTGSRFFISSSSSEDSSCPNNNNNNRPSPSRPLELAAQQFRRSLEASPEVEPEVALPQQLGVHCHSPMAGIPASQSFYRPGQLNFGPALVRTSRGAPVVAMSPVGDFAPTGSPLQAPSAQRFCQYKKSPSLFEITRHSNATNQSLLQQDKVSRFSSKWPSQQRPALSSFRPAAGQAATEPPEVGELGNAASASLHESNHAATRQTKDSFRSDEDYRLAEMLLELGQNKEARDENGCTALMQAVISDNLPAAKCLIEHGLNANDLNNAQLSCLDLLCARPADGSRLKILELLIDSGADFERARETDKTRLLDRLIGDHQKGYNDKLAYIDCLLQRGAKLSSSTWLAANGKHEIQLRLTRKICQDGYFLYKQASIEAAVYRFEYALRRLAELESQIFQGNCHLASQFQFQHPTSNYSPPQNYHHQLTLLAARRLKYQLYLGLSRAERKRKFLKRALEFAQMAILIDSTSYEGFYSKAHILKDLNELDESLVAIEQTSRLVANSIESCQLELKSLQQQLEELLIFDGCFAGQMETSQLPAGKKLHPGELLETARAEVESNLKYLCEAGRYIARLKEETLAEKLEQQAQQVA